MPENNEKEMDFLTLMKTKRSEEGTRSVIGETIEKAEKAEKKVQELELENVVLKKENQELKDKTQELERENKNLKEKIDHTIQLLTKSEEAINQAIEDKKQIEDKKNKEMLYLNIQINDLKKENENLKYKISELESSLK